MNMHLPPNPGIEERKSRLGVEKQAEAALLMDSTQGTVTYYAPAINRVKEAEARHGHINVLMVGGSVRAFKFDEIPKNDSVNTSTPSANGRAFWRGF